MTLSKELKDLQQELDEHRKLVDELKAERAVLLERVDKLVIVRDNLLDIQEELIVRHENPISLATNLLPSG